MCGKSSRKSKSRLWQQQKNPGRIPGRDMDHGPAKSVVRLYARTMPSHKGVQPVRTLWIRILHSFTSWRPTFLHPRWLLVQIYGIVMYIVDWDDWIRVWWCGIQVSNAWGEEKTYRRHFVQWEKQVSYARFVNCTNVLTLETLCRKGQTFCYLVVLATV